jgi:hypothetical protein
MILKILAYRSMDFCTPQTIARNQIGTATSMLVFTDGKEAISDGWRKTLTLFTMQQLMTLLFWLLWQLPPGSQAKEKMIILIG